MSDHNIDVEKSESSHVEAIEEENREAVHLTQRQQNTIRHKIDRHLLPIVCILYVLSYLDRGNIGNAKTAGAQKALRLSSDQWSWVLNSFYITYVLFEWTQLLWKILPAHIYVAALCILWGTTAMCSGVVTNMAGLIACRSLLGIFEAAFGAGAPYFLSLFYKRQELGFRVAILTGMSPLANCFAAALAYGITHIQGSLAPWRLLFLIEGAPTVAFSIIVFLWMADSPGTARFFTSAEQTMAVERLQVRDRTAKSKVSWKQITAGLLDYKPWIHMAVHFCCNYSFAGLSNFLPTIVSHLGYSNINAQGVTAPVYLAAFLCCVGAAYVSDRYGQRAFIIVFFALMGGVGYLLLTVVENSNSTRYAGVWLAACGVFPALSINITWLLNNQGGDSKRGAGLAVLAIFGQCSSFVSSTAFPDRDAPYFVKGCAVGCALTFLIALLAMSLRVAMAMENKKRDSKHGPVPKDTVIDVTSGGDNERFFRYLL